MLAGLFPEAGKVSLGCSVLKLRIEDFDKLRDGGPLEYSVNMRGFVLGQNSHF